MLSDRTSAATGRFDGLGPADNRPLRGGAVNARAEIDGENNGSSYSLARAVDATFPRCYEWSFPTPTRLDVVYADVAYAYREVSGWRDVDVQALIDGTWTTVLHWEREALISYGAGSADCDCDRGAWRDLSVLPSGFCEPLDSPTTAQRWRLKVNATTNGGAPDPSVLDTELPDGNTVADYFVQYNPTPRFDLARLVGAAESAPAGTRYLVRSLG